MEIERIRGYKRVTFGDFKLDAAELAERSSKIAISGIYLKIGDLDLLFPSLIAIAMMRETLNTELGIGLLITHAERDLRKYLLACQTSPASAQIGCPIHLIGRVSVCTKQVLLSSTNIPCLIVDDGWSGTPGGPRLNGGPPPIELQKAVARWEQLNEDCRGGSGDSPATDLACKEREKLTKQLQGKGWCFGRVGQATVDWSWQRCRDEK